MVDLELNNLTPEQKQQPINPERALAGVESAPTQMQEMLTDAERQAAAAAEQQEAMNVAGEIQEVRPPAESFPQPVVPNVASEGVARVLQLIQPEPDGRVNAKKLEDMVAPLDKAA